MSRRRDDATVYSSQLGRVCPRCGRAQERCRCRVRNPERKPEGDGVVGVRREVKGRGGKTVTTVSGVPLPPSELKALASDLKRLCGTGGALKQGVIEIQGDHREKLFEALQERGFQVKRSGG